MSDARLFESGIAGSTIPSIFSPCPRTPSTCSASSPASPAVSGGWRIGWCVDGGIGATSSAIRQGPKEIRGRSRRAEGLEVVLVQRRRRGPRRVGGLAAAAGTVALLRVRGGTRSSATAVPGRSTWSWDGRKALGSSLFSPVTLPKIPVVQLVRLLLSRHVSMTSPTRRAPRPRPPTTTGGGPRTPSTSSTSRMASSPGPRPSGSAGSIRPSVSRRLLRPPRRRRRPGVRPSSPTRGLGSSPGGRCPTGTKVITFVAKCRRPTPRVRPLPQAGECLDARAEGRRRGGRRRPEGRPRSLDVTTYHGRDYREVALRQDPPPDPDRFWFGRGSCRRRPWPRSWRSATFMSTRAGLIRCRGRCSRRWRRARVVLASDNPPVREVIRGGVDGLTRLDGRSRRLGSLGERGARRSVGVRAAGELRRGASSSSGSIAGVTLPSLAGRLNELAGLGG